MHANCRSGGFQTRPYNLRRVVLASARAPHKRRRGEACPTEVRMATAPWACFAQTRAGDGRWTWAILIGHSAAHTHQARHAVPLHASAAVRRRSGVPRAGRGVPGIALRSRFNPPPSRSAEVPLRTRARNERRRGEACPTEVRMATTPWACFAQTRAGDGRWTWAILIGHSVAHTDRARHAVPPGFAARTVLRPYLKTMGILF